MKSPSTRFINTFIRFTTTLIILIFFTFSGHSQENSESDGILSKFSEYSKTPREIAFAHLNKSVYIKGETVAFKVYVFDTYNKGLSKLTKNI